MVLVPRCHAATASAHHTPFTPLSAPARARRAVKTTPRWSKHGRRGEVHHRALPGWFGGLLGSVKPDDQARPLPCHYPPLPRLSSRTCRRARATGGVPTTQAVATSAQAAHTHIPARLNGSVGATRVVTLCSVAESYGAALHCGGMCGHVQDVHSTVRDGMRVGQQQRSHRPPDGEGGGSG